MMCETLVFYCTWGVKIKNGEYYISSLHNLYLNEAMKFYDKVVLLTSISLKNDECNEKIAKDIKVYVIPEVKSYLSAYKNSVSISKKIMKVSTLYPNATFYLRTPQPLSWLFSLLNRNNKLVYHFMSNPIEAIMTNNKSSFLNKIIKLILYIPDFLLTVLASRMNYCSCNGELLKLKLRPFVSKNSVVLNESTMKLDEFILDENVSKRMTNNPIKLLYVGYLRDGKGVNYLIEAIDDLLNKGYKVNLDIIGDGDSKDYLYKLVLDKGIKDSINFIGHISDRDVLIEAYRNADVFVFPSLSEGSPRVVIEALANGLPCVATNVGNTSNLLLDHGICIPPSDITSLSEGIETYILNEELRYKHALNGLTYSKKFTLSNFFMEFSKI